MMARPNRPPIAAFTVTVDGLEVTFTDASWDKDGTVDEWQWTFGDENEATQEEENE